MAPIRCPRCNGQVYSEDADAWCLACGECVSRPARPATPAIQAQVARDAFLDQSRGIPAKRRAA